VKASFHDRGSFADIESMVRAAGHYVEPTDDLRPRTIEAARERCSQQRVNRWIGGLALAFALLLVSGVPDFVRSSLDQASDNSPLLATSHELHMRAAQRSLDSRVGPHWAFYEVFVELRHEQAQLFRNSPQ